jgi:hypothetical protein
MSFNASIKTQTGQSVSATLPHSIVEVHERLGEPTTFRARFSLDVSEGDFSLLTNRWFDPGSVLQIDVPLDGGITACMLVGVVHGQQVHFEHGGAGSWVEVQGSDRLIELDRESKSVVWDGLASSAASTILSDNGFLPDVQITSTTYSDQTHQLVQRDSDLRFLRRLARRHGFHLWVTCGAFGVETAHFKPLPLSAAPAVTLAVNVNPPSIGSFDLFWDIERPTTVDALQLNLGTLTDIAGAITSPLPDLAAQGMLAISSDTRSVFVTAPADFSNDLTARGEGALVDAAFFVRANCGTSVAQLGKVVRAHTIAEVRGLGSRHSGNYLVSSVRHTIDAASHRMDVELLRNAWES